MTEKTGSYQLPPSTMHIDPGIWMSKVITAEDFGPNRDRVLWHSLNICTEPMSIEYIFTHKKRIPPRAYRDGMPELPDRVTFEQWSAIVARYLL